MARSHLWINRSSIDAPDSMPVTANLKDCVLKVAFVSVLLAQSLFGPSAVLADETVDSEKNVAVEGEANSQKPIKGSSKKAPASNVPISPEREAAALQFAQQNHPELASLIQNLKSNSLDDYRAALSDLDRTVERLSKDKDKSPEKYEIQLASWKNASRIRLLAARLAMKDEPNVEMELRAALGDRIKLRTSAQRADRERLKKRLEKVDQSIQEMTSNPEAMVEKQLADLRKSAASSKGSSKNRSKKATPGVSSAKDDAK